MFKFLLILFFCPCAFAQQNPQIKIIYKTYTNADYVGKETLEDPTVSPQIKSFIADKIKKNKQKTFVLIADKINSVYKEDNGLILGQSSNDKSWSSVGIELAVFKNIKTKKIVRIVDLMSKYFKVQDTLINFDWKIDTVRKKIGNYNCLKATLNIQPTKQELLNYQYDLKLKRDSKTNFFKIIEPKTKIITAWFAVEIPFNTGPLDYWGLPGLILELNDGVNSILCSEIKLNTTAKIDIPKNIKTVTKKQFDTIVINKNEELNEGDPQKNH
jgi:GLPGLI family protein